MQTINTEIAALLRQAVRAPRAYAQIQLPLITSPTTQALDYQKLGSQYVLEDITTLRRETLLAIGSDTLQFTFSNQDGSRSSISPTAALGRYFYPGPVDNKIALYLGISNDGLETVYPKGVYVSKAFNQDNQNGQNPATFNCLDQFYLCRGDVYTQLPPRLYGNQQSTYYNPAYAMNNPSGDLITYVCDAVDWMSTAGQNQAFANNWVPLVVYTSDDSSGSVATSHPYTVDYVNGTLTFGYALPSGTVVSADATPLAMTPELMLQHLFVDFAGLDPNFLRFDKSGIYLPIMSIAYDVDIVTVAQQVVMATAPKGVRWVLYFDESGNLIFTEPAVDGPPVVTLVDTFDILRSSPEHTADNIANVVTATAQCITNEVLQAVAYDVRSINIFSQKPEYDIPTQMTAAVLGLDTGSGMAFLNGLVNSFLFENSLPVIQTDIDILYNPALEAGDSVWVDDSITGINRQFYINQITESIQDGIITQTLRLAQFQASQDFQFGLSYYAGAAQDQNANAIQTADSLIETVTFNGTTVVTDGQPAMDIGYNPVVPIWNGDSLPISIVLGDIPGGGVEYIWRWMYLAEDSYNLSSVNILPSTDSLPAAVNTTTQPYTQFDNSGKTSQSTGTNGPSGATSLDNSCTTSGNCNMAYGITNGVSVTPGVEYTFSVWIKNPSADGLVIGFIPADGNDIWNDSYIIGVNCTPNSSGQRYSVSYTPTAGITQIRVVAGGSVPLTTGQKISISQPMLTEGLSTTYVSSSVLDTPSLTTGNGLSNGLTLPDIYNTEGTLAQRLAALAESGQWAPCPYDVAANNDSSRSRRFWWPLMRCSDWLSNDGVTSYSGNYTLDSTWTGGPGVTGDFTTYGQLRVGLSDYFGTTSTGYLGQALYASGTPAATALGTSSTSKYGVDFGPTISGTAFYGIKRVQTPGYLGIMVASTSGVVQLKRIPFLLIS